MTEDALRELCPLAALGALDGADRLAFAAEGPRHGAVGRDLVAFERLVGLIGVAAPSVPPSAGLRGRVVAAALASASASPPPFGLSGPRPWRTWLPLAAAAGLVLLALAWRSQRDEARQHAARSAAEAENLTAQNRHLQQRIETTKRRLDEAVAFRALVAHPGSRVAGLAGLPAAPAARGRVVWNADRREAVLLASGLPQTPAGKAYEAWIIAGGAPVAAGVFRAGDDGGAIHALPRLDDVARVKTFAVTIEPEAGTSAPTGPMVLAGPAP
jgi:hypothetical protein